MILADTSAWVEFLRATGSPAHRHLHDLVATGAPLVTTEIIIMEVFAGARDDLRLHQLRRLLFGCEVIPIRTFTDYEAAAALYRQCRRQGETVRSLVDCLIAAVALRAGASVLHADRDFDTLARCSPLNIVPLPGG